MKYHDVGWEETGGRSEWAGALFKRDAQEGSLRGGAF